MSDEKTKHFTEADYRAYIDGVSKALAGSEQLLAHIQNIERVSGLGHARRYPLPFVGSSSHANPQKISVRTQLAFRPTHLVVDPFIAHTYDLLDFVVGNRSMLLNADPLPLETFSVEAYAREKTLIDVQKWKGIPTIPVGCDITLVVQSRCLGETFE